MPCSRHPVRQWGGSEKSKLSDILSIRPPVRILSEFCLLQFFDQSAVIVGYSYDLLYSVSITMLSIEIIYKKRTITYKLGNNMFLN